MSPLTRDIIKAIFICLLLGPIESIAQDNDTLTLDRLSWLEGKWVNEKEEKVIHEEWEYSDTLISGKSFYVNKADTILKERLGIKKHHFGIYYIADVLTNKEPVYFKLKSISDNSVTFENLNHDFPKRIIYKLKNDNLLHARIEDDKNPPNGVDFLYRKTSK